VEACYDAFVAGLNPAGSVLVYASYLGGTDGDVGTGITVGNSGNTHVTGYTYSSDFPTTSGAYDTSFNGLLDIFVFKLNWTGGALDYSTYIGGSMHEFGSGIVIDEDGNAYVTGYTGSISDFPITGGAYDTTHNGASDVYILKLKIDLN